MSQSERLVTQPTTGAARSEPLTVVANLARVIPGSWRADILAIAGLLLGVLVTVALRWMYPNWLIDPDIYTMFLPWFGFIGDRTRDLDVPAWMPNFFGGSAMTGNPSAGWFYLPVHVIFAIWEVLTAYKVLVLVQLLIGGGATYALFRRIGLIPLAAMAGAAAFTLGPFAYTMTRYLVIVGQTNTFLPVALLGAEMSLRAQRLSSKLAWGILAGFALTQIFSAWPSQGIMYASIWLVLWCLFRTFVQPVDVRSTLISRIRDTIIAGAGAVFGFLGVGAAVVLPLLEYSSESSIPGGDYSHVVGSDYAADPRSLPVLMWYFMADHFSIRSEGYGAALFIMAIAAMLIAWREPGVLFFGFIFVFAATLPLEGSPTRWLLDLFPPFEHINGHRPIAVTWVLWLAPTYMAGALIQRLTRVRQEPVPRWMLAAITIIATISLAIVNTSQYRWIGWFSFWTMIAVLLTFAVLCLDLPQWVYRYLNRDQLGRLGVVALVGICFIFPTAGDIAKAITDPIPPQDGYNGRIGNDEELNALIDRGMARTYPGAVDWLLAQQDLQDPFRFTGYAGQGYPNSNYTWIYNSYWWNRYETSTYAVLGNGAAVRAGLEQTSGYNPVQIIYMYEYINIMNGAKQDYHWGDVFANVWADDDAQLLNMLNCKYILVDATIDPQREDMQNLQDNYNEVYRDSEVIIFENPRVYDRAWIVHDVRDNEDGMGLIKLRDDEVDGRMVAFVDGDIPIVQPATAYLEDGSAVGDSVTILSMDHEVMKLEATAVTDGLLVISNAYSGGWNAYVDGEQVEVLRTNHALQGVALPAGTHTIELRYEPKLLSLGLKTTSASAAVMLGVWGWAAFDWRRRRKVRSR